MKIEGQNHTEEIFRTAVGRLARSDGGVEFDALADAEGDVGAATVEIVCCDAGYLEGGDQSG